MKSKEKNNKELILLILIIIAVSLFFVGIIKIIKEKSKTEKNTNTELKSATYKYFEIYDEIPIELTKKIDGKQAEKIEKIILDGKKIKQKAVVETLLDEITLSYSDGKDKKYYIYDDIMICGEDNCYEATNEINKKNLSNIFGIEFKEATLMHVSYEYFVEELDSYQIIKITGSEAKDLEELVKKSSKIKSEGLGGSHLSVMTLNYNDGNNKIYTIIAEDTICDQKNTCYKTKKPINDKYILEKNGTINQQKILKSAIYNYYDISEEMPKQLSKKASNEKLNNIELILDNKTTIEPKELGGSLLPDIYLEYSDGTNSKYTIYSDKTICDNTSKCYEIDVESFLKLFD